MKLLCFSALLAISTIHASQASLEPLVHVARCEDAPVIDGQRETPSWDRAISIQDFLTPDSHHPLGEGTDVRILWDERALYISARMEESVLSVVSQQQHEIKAAATERDGNVFNDDSFLVILRPPNSSSAFEFSVNTLGTISDAKSDPVNLWKSRDLAWNARIKAAAKVDDGSWTAELAIPWSELGVKAPKPGEQWSVVLARNAAKRRENGSWNPSRSGAHNPEQWGSLRFGEATPGIQLVSPVSTLEPGSNQMVLSIAPGAEKENLLISSRLAVRGKKTLPSKTNKTVSISPSSPVSFPFDFDTKNASGPVTFSWHVADAASLEPLYRSPEIQMEVQASSVALHLQTSGAYRLLVNDLAIAKGEKAEGKIIKIPLRSGPNVLALETESGTANLRLESALLGDAPIRWKMHEAEAAKSLNAQSDDSQWPTAPVDEQGEVGRPGAPAVLRHTILYQSTRIFPTPLPALYIAGNAIQPVTFTAWGIPGKTLNGWKVFLELPPVVKPVGATGYYGTTIEGKPRFTLREEEGSHRAIIEADRPIIPYKPEASYILSVFDVALRQNENLATPAGEHYTMRHFARGNDGTVSELAQTTSIRLLPRLNGRSPKALNFQIWSGYTKNMDDPQLRSAMIETAANAGFNDFISAKAKDLEGHGLGSTMLVNFKSSSLNLMPWLHAHPEARLINAKGKPVDFSMCTTVLLESGWKEAGAPLLKKRWTQQNADTINYDYEYPPFSGPHSCYCSRCMEAFRKTAQIPETKPIDAAVIRKEYSAQWVDFMARRAASLFAQMKETVHELPGTVKFEVYSGYQTPENTARYGIDWRYVGELKAVDRVGVGYGRPVPGIDDTLRALPGIPVMFGDLIIPYATSDLAAKFNKPTRQTTKASLLRRFIDSTGGALIYHTQNMDGRSWFAAAETSRLIAEFEPAFGQQRAYAIPGQPEDEVQVLRNANYSLVCVMNLSNSEKTYSFSPGESLGAGREFYSGQTLKAGESIQIVLPPGETAVYVFNP